jgi:hypothetical protein
MRVSKNFILQEFVPEYDFNEMGEKAKKLLDRDLIPLAQALRDVYGPIHINTWALYKDGSHYRGWRPRSCDVGSKRSQHKFGRALDMTFLDEDPEDVLNSILDNQDFWMSLGINRMMLGDRFLHVDMGWHKLEGQILLL